MAIVIGTNAGFVTVAPTADPGGQGNPVDYLARSNLYTAPAGNNKVIEMGWWMRSFPGDPGENFQLGIYSDNAGEPGNLLVMEEAVLLDAPGWGTVSLDFELTPATAYWLAVVCQASTPGTDCSYVTTGANDYSIHLNTQTLPNPWVEAGSGVYLFALYALIEGAGGESPAIAFGANF